MMQQTVKGILGDQSGQDTLEYAAMGLIAVLLGAIVIGIMRTLLLDCMMLDIC